MTKNTEPEEVNTELQTPSYKKELIIGAAVVGALLAMVAGIALFIYNTTPRVVYQPIAACDTLSVTEARDLLGGEALNATTNNPVISGNTATSRCGYTDGSSETENILVAAVIVRSGINDKGVQQNKNEFTAGTPTQAVESINTLGDSAYFNNANGQLNVLKGRHWYILSYGVGSTPQVNTIEDVTKLAEKVLN